MTSDTIARILNFWFGDPAGAESEYGQQRRIWFHKDAEFDQRVRQQFLSAYEQAQQGAYQNWMQTPRGALALTVLLDQFPRNMFRGTPRSFEADAQALLVSQSAIAQECDRAVLPVERMFFYLPFEHSENLAHQNQAVALFEDLTKQAPDLQPTLEYAYRHREVIAQFGRFPHRNAILGRTSTAAESRFLEQAGSRF
ncbi:MAG: DUF924 domain-containing protein [Leptolyngbyaceae cyanobacterium SM1_1_3]|nr:DUF924 domain-containing protein [Leptolyngbyaceae cyanobacterium SM1_1_3]NJN04209.1 DUF924 domain-containing protein [Leptolyngbyaceae cyanobacterium RM1_1_2]NJO08338.1 DUF924 domain-containing protein [Leptolyngbyaceae cyanobacterium SL_1_1]